MLFLIPVADYFVTLRKREVLMDWGFPAVAAIAIAMIVPADIAHKHLAGLKDTAVNLLAIFTGFSVTALTLLVTSESTSIRNAKAQTSDRSIRGTTISQFQLIHATISFSVIAQITALLLNLTIAFSIPLIADHRVSWMFYTLDAFLLTHVFLLNLRHVAYLYFLFWAPDQDRK